VSDPTSARDLGVYVHVPFCERVCPYCDFAVEAVGTLGAARERLWLDGVLRELDGVRAALGDELQGRTLATVYFGGGTPSLLDPGSVERVLGALREAFPGVPDEITLEMNPGVVEVARVPGFKAAGVTRVSLGVQSLHDGTLKRLGRAHKGADARAGLDACVEAGFASLSADLIWGAPGQEEHEIVRDLHVLMDLRVPHISAYGLTIEDGTPFGRARDKGRLKLPDEDSALRQWARARAVLSSGGVEQYEISSFARPGHRARHNSRYWQRRPVLGLGPSAASQLGPRRFQNLRDTGPWLQALQEGERPLAEDTVMEPSEILRERFWLGLRLLGGISRADWGRRFGRAPESDLGPELRELRELGLLADVAGHIRLTERGILFSDEVFVRFAGR